MRHVRKLVLAAILALLGFWIGYVFFPSPERVIRQHLIELSGAASIPPNEPPITRLANVVKLASLCTPDVEVSVEVPGHSFQNLQGRDRLREAALAARSTFTTLTVEFVDISVLRGSDPVSAVANLTAKASFQGELVPQELKIEFRKVGRDWLIERVSTVKTLR